MRKSAGNSTLRSARGGTRQPRDKNSLFRQRSNQRFRLALGRSERKGLREDASVLFQNITSVENSARIKTLRQHIFRKMQATTLAMRCACALQGVLAVTGLVRLYVPVQASGDGSGQANTTSTSASATLPAVTSKEAVFVVATCSSNLLFGLFTPFVLWFADADFSERMLITVVCSTWSSLIGLLIAALAVAFSVK